MLRTFGSEASVVVDHLRHGVLHASREAVTQSGRDVQEVFLPIGLSVGLLLELLNIALRRHLYGAVEIFPGIGSARARLGRRLCPLALFVLNLFKRFAIRVRRVDE